MKHETNSLFFVSALITIDDVTDIFACFLENMRKCVFYNILNIFGIVAVLFFFLHVQDIEKRNALLKLARVESKQ